MSKPPRLIDMPADVAAEFKAQRRNWVLLGLLNGRSEDEIYRLQIDIVIEAAREEGCDESDVEVIAALTRRHVAEALAEFREPRDMADWKPDILAALAVAEEARAFNERGGEQS